MAKRKPNKRLDFCNFKLETLLEITQMINENLPTEQLIAKYEKLLMGKLNLGKLLIYGFDKSWNLILKSGFNPIEEVSLDVERDLLEISDITTVTAANLKDKTSLDTIIPVFHNNKQAAFVLIGDVEEEREGVSPTIKHLLFIQTLTYLIIVAIENHKLMQQSIKQEALKRELQVASRMQEMLIPETYTFPRNDKTYVDAFYLPHFDVGGDYYDFFSLNDKEYAFCMSDVSGKGISAAILMSNFQANLKALFTAEIPLDDLVRKLNKKVMDSANGEKFITLFIGKYNLETKKLTYINAGHNPPFYYNIETEKLIYLEDGCQGMGMLDFLQKVNIGELTVDSNAKLLSYTDGLVELEGEDSTDAGMESVADCMKNDLRIDKNIKNIIEKMDIGRENAVFFDDISILGIQFYK